jgi:glutamyl-tRNA reductase
MPHVQSEIISIADACLGGLRGRSALLIGPEETRDLYKQLLQKAGTATVFQETDYTRVSSLLPQVQLVMNMPDGNSPSSLLPAATIAQGCTGRRTPLLIFDLASSTSVEEMAGLLPAVCLYTPSDLRHVLQTNSDACVRS